jgi:hypothetical protein
LIPREIVHTDVEPLRLLDPQIPEQLDLLVQRALLKDPAARLQTGEEFAAGLYLAAQELRRQASASAPAAPAAAPVQQGTTEAPAPIPDWVVNQSTAFAGPGAGIQPAPRAAEQPVRERPQDAASKPRPWTARSYAASAPLTKETTAAPPEPRPEPAPKTVVPAAPQPAAPALPVLAAPAPVVEVWAPPPPPPPNPGAPVPSPSAQQPPNTAAPRTGLVTKRAITLVAGLILAAVIVGSFVSRKGLQASQDKKSVPVVVARPPAAVALPAKPAAAEPVGPAAAQPGESGPDDVGNPEFSAKETLHGPVRALWESGRYAEALALVNQVLANNPNNAEARAWKKKVRDAQAAEAALK